MLSKFHSKGSRRIVPSGRPTFTQADFLTRAGRNRPVTINFPHPLSWWRTRRAEHFREVDVAIVRLFLMRSAIIGEPHWFLAASGDAAVAIGVAIRAQRQNRLASVSLDLAMSAVLCTAIKGDLAATLLLSCSLKRQSELDPQCAALADSWLSRGCGPSATLH